MVVRRRQRADQAPRAPLARSALLTYGTQVAVAILSLANVLLVARVLGPAGRGQVAFLTTVAYLVSQLALLGVHQANANIGGREPEQRPSLATNSILFSMLVGVAAIGVVAGLIAVFPAVGARSDPALRWLALASIPVLILQNHLLLLVQSAYSFVVANTAWLVGPVINVVVNGLFAAVGTLSVGTAVATWIAGQGLGTALLVWHVARRSAGFGRPDWSLARRSLVFGVKAHPGRVMLLGNYRLDQWLLGAIGGARELGLYTVAVAWTETLFYLPTVLTQVQRPDLVRADRREAVRQTTTAVRAAVLATVPLALVLFLAAPILCISIFGDDFGGSVGELRVLTAGSFGILLLKLLGNALTAQQRPLLETLAVGIAFVAIVVLDASLIPAYGGLGAAVASTIAYSVGGIAVALIFARVLGGRLRELFPRAGDIPWLAHKVTDGFRRAAPEGDAPRAPVGLP